MDPSDRTKLYPKSDNSLPVLEALPMAPILVPTLEEIANQFKKSVTVGDHRYRLKIYKDCFVGEEAVSYLVHAKFATSRSEAVELVDGTTKYTKTVFLDTRWYLIL